MHAGALAHALDRLGSTARVLYVAAHPDDENTRLLAYLASGRHVKAAYLSMTRGGGGQNLIGIEQGALLDVLRTEELLAARALDGAEQRFTRMRDFGYSKTAEETFTIWGHEEALRDVVQVVRSFQPDVIITRFDEKPPNHGHHTASAILAREAFHAAADPERFPGLGPEPWQATRLLHNVSPWRGPPPPGALAVDVGAYDPRLGLGYAELAALSRSEHKSQGFGASGERGSLLEHFTVVAGSAPEGDLLEGIPLRWERFGPKGRELDGMFAEARRSLDRDHPERSLPLLLQIHDGLQKLPPSQRRDDALEDLKKLIRAASGLFLRATAESPFAAPGSELSLRLEIVQRLPAALRIQRAVFPDGAVVKAKEQPSLNEKLELEHLLRLPKDTPITTPYWLRQTPAAGRYQVAEGALIGAPRGPAALSIGIEVELAGRQLRFDEPVVHTRTDRVHGERVRPFTISPPATVTPTREAVLLPNGRAAEVALRIRAAKDDFVGVVELGLPDGWSSIPASERVELPKVGDERTVRFQVQGPPSTGGVALRVQDAKAKSDVSSPRPLPPPGATPSGPPQVERAGSRSTTIHPSLLVEGKRWSLREDTIDYPHVPVQRIHQQASLRLVAAPLELPQGRVGYVMGSGDSIADDLAHVGAEVVLLDDEQLRSGDLSAYSSIVVGIRAYNTRPALVAAHDRLMRYVEGGGVVVVQYVTSSRFSPFDEAIGPFPLEIGPGRVTDETAEMSAINPSHPLLQAPNHIGPADFEGWVQERGLYFGAKWDSRYQPLFRAADPNEEPLEGSVLVARHGRGRYVYTGLAFFRQLRAGVPGAYRLFSNLLSPP